MHTNPGQNSLNDVVYSSVLYNISTLCEVSVGFEI